MPDDTLIFKLELDSSNYIRGVDAAAGSLGKLTTVAEEAKKRLDLNEAALRANSSTIDKARKDLEAYTGTNERYRKQLEKNLTSAESEQVKLTKVVDDTRAAYDRAQKSAQGFAETSQRAANLQQQTTGGKIPTSAPLGTPPPPIIQEIRTVVDSTQLEELPEILAQTEQEFNELRNAINLAEDAMKSLDVNSDEFRELGAFVQKGKIALEAFDNATKQTGGSQTSLRSQLRLAREELVRLEQAGKGASKEYLDLELRTAKLTDAFADQQARIKILASDTRLLDFGKGAITAATSAFQAYTSVAILVGDESEELQKKTMQLFAAMQLLTSLEQLSNLVRREGVIAIGLQSAAQTVYTTVVGASTGALRAFRLALLATGVGAAIAGIAFLISRFTQAKNAIKEAGEQQRRWNEVVKQGNESAGKQIADLKILTAAVKDETLSRKERLKAVAELQKQFPEHFGNLSKETLLTKDLTKETNALILSIQASSRARAAKGRIDAIESEKLDREFQKQKINTATFNESQRAQDVKETRRVGDKETGEFKKVVVSSAAQQKFLIEERRKAAVKAEDDRIKELDREEQFLIDKAKLGEIAKTIPDKETAAKKAIDNEFDKRKAELDQRLAELTRKEADNESKIRVEFAARLQKELLDIEKAQREKKLTAPQAKVLTAETIVINQTALDKELEDFRKKVAAAREKINDELRDLQSKATQDSINLLQDEFTRRAQLIDFNEQKELEDTKEHVEDRLKALELDRLLIGEEDYQRDKAIIITNGEQQAINIIRGKSLERQKLAADLFKNTLDIASKTLDEQLLQIDEAAAEVIQGQLALLDVGAINYDQFQKKLTQILKDQKDKRDRLRLEELKAELKAIDDRLKVATTAAEKEELESRRTSVRKQIVEIKAQAPTTDPNATKQVETVQQYAEAIGQLTESIVSFWQKANQAESEALDRSIALQEKRVDAAQRIAERGNAQYLKAESDRLKELQVKRENAARRDLAINAALQASQLLVGITGAISKIANPVTGIAETIGAIATIFAALATGYALAKSLQGNQPTFFEGTPELKRGKHPKGRDTIPAWLNEGEAIIPTERNTKYKKAVEAIYYEKVPAEVMNEFVHNYVTNKNINTKSTSVKNVENYVYDTTNENLSTYKQFVQNVSQVPAKALNSFINNYKEIRAENLVLKQPTIPQPTLKAIFDAKIPVEHINSFVREYHSFKPVPQPHFERIKEAAESKVQHDGKLTKIIGEQNKLLEENNQLQRQTLRAMSKMSISATVDKDGVAIMVNEHINQLERDKKL